MFLLIKPRALFLNLFQTVWNFKNKASRDLSNIIEHSKMVFNLKLLALAAGVLVLRTDSVAGKNFYFLLLTGYLCYVTIY